MNLPNHYDVDEMFEDILEFKRDNPGKLNGDFVDSVYSFYCERGYVTENQKQALINIYDGFKLGEK